MQIDRERHPAAQRDGQDHAPGDAAMAPRLLESLLAEAARLEASHLHLDPGQGRLDIAFRAGGLIHPFRELPVDQGAMLIQEIALGAGLAAASPLPQRGRLRWRREWLEVSMLPVRRGQRVVLQRAPLQSGHRGLEELGMSATLAHEARAAIGGTGLVLVAAPPGNGRSSTLRTLLAIAASRTRPALAITGAGMPELPGVAWADGANAAESLRAGIEQDFDVLMVDSLADRAGAAAAVEAAQGGRLVLAGVEAEGAVAALQQLRSWRVEAFHLASSLTLVIGQRLVRRLCPSCREPVQASGSVSALLGFDPGAIVYAAAGCADCEGSGFAGQIGVFESIRGDAVIRRLVNDGGDAAILARHAFISVPNLGSAARALARSGVTTPEEAVRISRG